jgi:hypothetical protein
MANKVMSRAEIYRQMEHYLNDDNKIISVRFFAELAGCSMDTIYTVFKYKEYPLSEIMQIRISRALEKLKRGEVRVMRNRDRTHELHYLKKAKPVMTKGYALSLTGGKIGLKIGPHNRADYSQAGLMEKPKCRS